MNFVTYHSEARDKYKDATGRPANHDRALAEEVTLSDGTPAWVIAVADGCGGDDRGTRVAQLAVDRLHEVVAAADAKTLSHSDSAGAWADRWARELQNEVMQGPLKGGNSTLCAVIALKDRTEAGAYRLVAINVGDTRARILAGRTLEVRGIVPHAPEGNPNTSENGKSLCRAVGLIARANFPFLDVEVSLIDAKSMPAVVVINSDGADSYSSVVVSGGKQVVRENTLLYPRELKKIISDGYGNFDSLPKELLDRSLLNASAHGFTRLDNSTIAMLGLELNPGSIKLPKELDEPLPPPKASIRMEPASIPQAPRATTKPASAAAPKASAPAKPASKSPILLVASALVALLAVVYFAMSGADEGGSSAVATPSPPMVAPVSPSLPKGPSTRPVAPKTPRKEATAPAVNKVAEQKAKSKESIKPPAKAVTDAPKTVVTVIDPKEIKEQAKSALEKAQDMEVPAWPKAISSEKLVNTFRRLYSDCELQVADTKADISFLALDSAKKFSKFYSEIQDSLRGHLAKCSGCKDCNEFIQRSKPSREEWRNFDPREQALSFIENIVDSAPDSLNPESIFDSISKRVGEFWKTSDNSEKK